MFKNYFLVLLLSLCGCLGIPKGVKPVKNFDLNRYLGTWYEIARLDHSFERGLINVSAKYTLKDDGGIKVLNQGFNKSTGKWSKALGKAYFIKDQNTGYLKVSFFGPFYSSYIIFELDEENYQYAFICGYNKSYLWLLSRNKSGNDIILKRFIEKAKKLGFNTDKLIIF